MIAVKRPKQKACIECGLKFYNEDLHNLYSSPNIIRMIKSKGMRWARYIACVGEKSNSYRILVGKPEGNRPLGRQDIGGWIIVKWIFNRMQWHGLDSAGSG
jgi:hypothetical protein